jgi:hypothetical protein
MHESDRSSVFLGNAPDLPRISLIQESRTILSGEVHYELFVPHVLLFNLSYTKCDILAKTIKGRTARETETRR